MRSEIVSFAKCSKKTIPPRDVAIIEIVEIELMVNGVVLWSL